MKNEVYSRIHIGDYIIYKKDESFVVYEVLLLNHSIGTVTVKIIHPPALVEATRHQAIFNLKAQLIDFSIIRNKKLMKALYGV